MTKVEGLYQQILSYHPKKNISIVTVGNKTDLLEDRKIKNEEVELLAQKNKSPYIECSAMTG
jgi:GTPase SAR1 family protein